MRAFKRSKHSYIQVIDPAKVTSTPFSELFRRQWIPCQLYVGALVHRLPLGTSVPCLSSTSYRVVTSHRLYPLEGWGLPSLITKRNSHKRHTST